MTGFIKLCVIAGFAALLAGCAHSVSHEIACVDLSSGTLFVTVTNKSDVSISVPIDTPHIGCCNAVGLALAVTDAKGVELNRCGTSDNFDVAAHAKLRPSESRRYELSEMSVRGVYCNIELTKYFIKASIEKGNGNLQVAPNVEQIRQCRSHELAATK